MLVDNCEKYNVLLVLDDYLVNYVLKLVLDIVVEIIVEVKLKNVLVKKNKL